MHLRRRGALALHQRSRVNIIDKHVGHLTHDIQQDVGSFRLVNAAAPFKPFGRRRNARWRRDGSRCRNFGMLLRCARLFCNRLSRPRKMFGSFVHCCSKPSERWHLTRCGNHGWIWFEGGRGLVFGLLSCLNCVHRHTEKQKRTKNRGVFFFIPFDDQRRYSATRLERRAWKRAANKAMDRCQSLDHRWRMPHSGAYLRAHGL